MDHEVVVRQQMTERYLLDELDPHERAEFEEHFFEWVLARSTSRRVLCS
jgi:hypothetical protein